MSSLSSPKLLAVLLFFVGTLSIYLTPPFQVSDEPAHFFRAFQISEGSWLGIKQGDHSGGILPLSVVQDSTRFEHLIGHTYTPLTKREWETQSRASAPLNPANLENREFHDFSNTVNYSPVIYIPQALGVSIAKFFQLNTFSALYLARFCNLFIASLLIWLALESAFFTLQGTSRGKSQGAPQGALALFLLAGMPMTLFQLGSASSDALTFAFAFLVSALIARLNIDFKRFDFALFLGVSALLSLSKSVYFLLPLAILPILFQLKIPLQRKLSLSFSTITAAILPSVLWSFAAKRVYSPVLREFVADPHQQLLFFLHNPIPVLKGCLLSFIKNTGFYAKSFVGILGWLDTPLPPKLMIIYLFTLVLTFWIAPRSQIKKNTPWLSAGSLFISVTTVTLIFFLTYLTSEPVGALYLDGIQGRYFIPIVALCMLTVTIPKRMELKVEPWRKWQVGLTLGWCISSFIFLMTLRQRFWV